ncbi:MAG: amidohydrolase family protein [Gemmatimonadaceae bacterium]|nr:amidohydrolase family protein [Gemmatimonadaceae bacterium]
MNHTASRTALLVPLIFGCHAAPSSTAVSSVTVGKPAEDARSDTAQARRVFEANIDAIHKRDRARYLSYYLQTDQLARNGPSGLDLGFADWPARRDSTWPDTLVARDLRLVPVAPGMVYGTYHYRVTQAGATSEGISERVFVRTPAGFKIAVSTAFGLPEGAAPPPVTLLGGTLINPGAAAVSNASIVVRDGRIACAGTRAECVPPPGAERVDVSGKFITPGLIDAHVHYSQTGWVDARPDAVDLRAEHPYDSVIAALQRNPAPFDRAWLCSGVTAVFDVGGFAFTIPMARAHERSLTAPRMAAAGPLLSSRAHWLNLPFLQQFIAMTGDSIVRATVSGLDQMGAGALKVWYLQLPDSLQPQAREMLMAAGDAARRAGLPLIVHATQLPRAKEALTAGARILVHSVDTGQIDDAFITAARRNGTIVIPTLTVREGYADVALGRSPAARYPLECVDAITRSKLERVIPEARRTRLLTVARGGVWDRQRPTMELNLRKLHEAGIPIAMGTDAGNPGTAHGPSVYREMEAMQAAGMTAREVLRSATLIAARAMGRDADIGSLERGKHADLVVFDADPSADIANARRVRMVMRGGALYGRAELLPMAR